MKTPVAVIAFNRPEETARVLEAVCRARPPLLMVVADGPREGRDAEAQRCDEVRRCIDRFRWDCEVRRNFSDANLGCRRRVASGLDWVFTQVPEAVILEDDCLPEASFFGYCDALLEHYRDDERVMHVGGNNFGLDAARFGGNSYGFASLAQVWGWASWRRAWQHFDVALRDWPAFRDLGCMGALPLGRRHRALQARRWDDVHEGRVDTWDFQWHFALMRRGGLATVPRVNLITNVGFSADATHTTDLASEKANLPTQSLTLPLTHPRHLQADPMLDRQLADKMLGAGLPQRVRQWWRRRRMPGNGA